MQHFIPIYNGEELVFRAGEQKTFSFDADSLQGSLEEQELDLFVKAEPVADAALLSEWGGGLFMRDVDDSLSTVTHHSRFSLRFEGTEEPAGRCAYYKLRTDPPVYPGGLRVTVPQPNDTWQLSFYTKGVDFEPLGVAELRAEIFYRREDRHPADICGKADEIRHFPFRAGSYDFFRTEAELCLRDVAVVLFTVCVENSRGELYVEDVALSGVNGLSLLPKWMPHCPYAENLNWFGENLSHREWADFTVTLNGEEVGRHSFFSSIYKYNENEFSIQNTLKQKNNELTLAYRPDYFCPIPYRIVEVKLICRKKTPFSLLSSPRTAVVGQPLMLALEVFEQPLAVTLSSSRPEVVPAKEVVSFETAGWQTVEFSVTDAVGETVLTLTGGGHTEAITLSRTVERGNDGVLCGTGDAIYIPQRSEPMHRFLRWYLQNECGSFLTLRPVYHWSGTKSLNPAFWQELIPFLNQLKMPYCLLFDERELPGLNANPPEELLRGEYFLGYQGHERDGSYNYWSNDMWNCDGTLYRELRARNLAHPQVDYKMPVHYRGNQAFVYYDPAEMTDQRRAAEYFEENVGNSMRGCIRHTGVTMLFRHFLRTGVEVPGAEIMYAGHELLLSALRGSAAAYKKDTTASHLALQWYSQPVGYFGFHARYALSLRVSYLHGIKHINTEEGLWRMEFGFESHDRFSKNCQDNIKEQRRFLHFVNSHTRRGTPAHRHGILFGAYDGFTGYGDSTRPIWHNDAAGWEFGAPEASWEHLKLYYPDNAITQRVANRVRVTEEPGWFTRTPYGLCEILPVEAPDELLQSYPYLAFLGYNLADRVQIEALLRYAESGGTLLLCLCHLSNDCNRSADHAKDYCTQPADGYQLLTGFAVETVTTADGFRAAMADMSGLTVLQRTATGAPLLLERRVGAGRILLVNSFEFPSHPAIEPLYRETLKGLAEAVKQADIAQGEIDIHGAPVEYAIYDLPTGGRRIYLLNTDWTQEDGTVEAELLLGGKRYRLPVRFGQMGIVEVRNGIAAYTCEESTEILSLRQTQGGLELTLQGEGTAEVHLLGGTWRPTSPEAVPTQNSQSYLISCKGKRSLHFAATNNGGTLV